MVCLFWQHSCETQCESLENPHEFSQNIHYWKGDEILYQNT